MRLTKVQVRNVGQIPGEEGVEDRAYIVHVDLETKLGDEPMGFGIKLSADVPYDPNLTYEEISKRGVARAREMLATVSAESETLWFDLHRESLEPRKPFVYNPT